MENTLCTKYSNLLYLCKTIGHIPFDLHSVEARHRYTMVIYFMNAGSYNANTNCIVLGSVNTINFFDNAVGDREIGDTDGTVFLENIIDVLQRKKSKLVGNFVH